MLHTQSTPSPSHRARTGDAVAAALRQAVHQRDLEGIEGGIYLYRLWSAAVQGIGHAVEHYRIHLGELQHRAERMGVVAMDCASIVPGGGAKQMSPTICPQPHREPSVMRKKSRGKASPSASAKEYSI